MRRNFLLSVLALVAVVLGLTSSARAAGPAYALESSLNGASGSFFGYSVAIDGSTAIVGALDDNSAKGAAYVYVLTGTAWTQQQVLTAPDGVAGDELGYEVALSGNTAMVSAAGKANGQGYVYVFTRPGTAWSLGAEITSPDGVAGDCFGCAIALRGTTALLGASGKQSGTGGVYAYAASGSAWQEVQSLVGATGEYFGFSVALSSDAKTAIVGGFLATNATGHAYVLTSNGTTWSQAAVLAASDGQAGDRFGYSVGVDGTTAIVGAYSANGGKGAAYVFAGSAGSWTQQPKLLAADGTANDQFGYAVAISGATAIVGAPEKSSGAGAAYVFVNGGVSWSQQELSPSGASRAAESFGYSVGVAANGVVVGAFSASNDSGAASLFASTSGVAAPAVGATWIALLALLLPCVAFGSLCRTPRARRVGAVAFQALALAFFAAGTAACSGGADGETATRVTTPSGEAPSPQDTGSVGMDLTLSGGENVAVVNWSITGPRGAATVVQASSVKVQASAIQFLVSNIPAASGYSVALSSASTDKSVTCSGSAQFDVTAHAMTHVAVQLGCVSTGSGSTGTNVDGTSFNCAAWSSVTANPLETKVGSTVVLSAVANGPQPTLLTYAWSSSTGAFSPPNAATSSFTCTQAGQATVTLVVGDGPVPAGSTCNPTLDTTTVTVTCDAPTTVAAPGMPAWGLMALVAGLLAIGISSIVRNRAFPSDRLAE
jgi:hypothetical protein